ncbi:phosphoribosylformylglycinamidine cyclo-ligase [Candidatus Micrarchaeota archaeon]|nr:phosphoribosylformylglycinamidine cyclo-ligase [Candidatus Micrarchaeota archaeon]
MKNPYDISHVKKIQNAIWSNITTTMTPITAKNLELGAHYGGVFQVGNEQLVMHTDGVGTKLLIAQELEKYNTVGIDAIAMNVNDILCLGAEPLVGVDYIALEKEDDFLVEELMKGLVAGAKESNCAIIGGETAIIPEIIKGGKRPFDLTFTVVGKIRKKLITGQEIKPGQIIIGLESSGLHSNGFTLARKVLDMKKWGKEMLEPTKIYCKSVLEMIESDIQISGLAHITGGGFSKLTRLNKEVGFELTSIPKPPKIFDALFEKVKDSKVMHTTFNMGIGMAIILEQQHENQIKSIAKKHGVNSFVIGKTTNKKGGWLESDGKDINLTL